MTKSPEGTGFFEHLKPDEKTLRHFGVLALLGVGIYAVAAA